MCPDPIEKSAERMKADWNDRANENARYFIASTEFESEEEFRDSGERDVGLLFSGLEHLLHPEQSVLDIGCGIGRMDQVVAPKVRSITGVDVSSEMVAQARARLADTPNAKFIEVSGCDLSPIPDNSISLLFSHIVFQHIPKAVVLNYITEAYRVIVPGGHLVFQVPERFETSPPDPADDDTFGMRYYTEDEIRYLMEHIQYQDIQFGRLAATEADSIDHLRVSARTCSVYEKMADPENPSESELEEWAYTWCPEAPKGWFATIATPGRSAQFLKFAADPGCPQRDWFLSGLYAATVRAVTDEKQAEQRTSLTNLISRARNFHGHPWVTTWADDAERLLENGQSKDEMVSDHRPYESILTQKFNEQHSIANELGNVLVELSKEVKVDLSQLNIDLAAVLADASSPRTLQSLLPGVENERLANRLWFRWRRIVADAN